MVVEVEKCQTRPMVRREPVNIADDRELKHDLGARTQRPTWTKGHGGLRMKVWRDPWYDVLGIIDTRDIIFSISAGDRLVAAGAFQQWGTIEGATLRQFVEHADALSLAAYNMALTVQAGWTRAEKRSLLSPLDYGCVVHLERLIITPKTAAESDAVWRLIESLIERQFSNPHRHRDVASVIVLKAFPLKFEAHSDAEQTAPWPRSTERAFNRSLEALMRLYGRRLGAKEFGGKGVERGWMWVDIALDPGVYPEERKAAPPRRRAIVTLA